MDVNDSLSLELTANYEQREMLMVPNRLVELINIFQEYDQNNFVSDFTQRGIYTQWMSEMSPWVVLGALLTSLLLEVTAIFPLIPPPQVFPDTVHQHCRCQNH